MNKIIIGIVAIIAIGIAWFILNPGDTLDYVVTIDKEVTQLEEELASLDAQVAAGTLSPEQATQAKVRIITRLDAINEAATQSESMQLTVEQRTQLANGLLRLKDALVTYQATLEAIENTSVEADVKAKLSSGHSGSGRNLSLIVADTIEDLEETVSDSVMDYEADAAVDAEIDAIVEETEGEMDSQEESTTAEDEMDSEENMEEDEDTSSTTDETQDEEMLDADMEVSSEAQIQVTQ